MARNAQLIWRDLPFGCMKVKPCQPRSSSQLEGMGGGGGRGVGGGVLGEGEGAGVSFSHTNWKEQIENIREARRVREERRGGVSNSLKTPSVLWWFSFSLSSYLVRAATAVARLGTVGHQLLDLSVRVSPVRQQGRMVPRGMLAAWMLLSECGAGRHGEPQPTGVTLGVLPVGIVVHALRADWIGRRGGSNVLALELEGTDIEHKRSKEGERREEGRS